MTDKKEDSFKFEKPTEDDEKKKSEVLELWLQDRMTLLTWRPFLGMLSMHLEIIPVVDYRCQTACTDGRKIFFNPYFIGNLTPEHRITILAHEIWHCALLHFSREIGRIDQHKAWNYAIDHEVNTLLDQDGFELPPGAILYSEHRGRSAEQIFDMILDGELPLDGMLMDEHYVGRPEGEGGEDIELEDQSGPLVSEGEGGTTLVKVDSRFIPRRSDDVWKEWQENLKSACQRSGNAGIDMSGYGWAIDDLLEPRIHWKELLRQFITPMLGSTRQWLPPNRRFVTQGLYLPSRKHEHELKIVIAIDTSGSTVGRIVQEFVSEVTAIVNSFGAYHLTIIQCDLQIHEIEKYTHEDPFDPEDFALAGGGGTDLRPPFFWVREEMGMEPPKALLYMTDGFGPAPDSPPDYPVLWVINDQGVPPCSWGQVVRIEDE